MKNDKRISNFKLTIGILLSLFLILLGASIIRDILILILKDSFNKIIFQIIHFILIYIMITFFLKIKQIKLLEEELTKKFKKKK